MAWRWKDVFQFRGVPDVDVYDVEDPLAGIVLVALVVPAAPAQCVSNVPMTLEPGFERVHPGVLRMNSPTPRFSSRASRCIGPNGVPVLIMQAGCQSGATPCNTTCTAITPPPLVLGGDPYYPDNYYGENECFIMYLFWMHDAVWGLEIYTFCDGCFCLTYDDQLPVEFRSPFAAVAGKRRSDVAVDDGLRVQQRPLQRSARGRAEGDAARPWQQRRRPELHVD